MPEAVTSHPLRSYLANLTLLHEMLNIPSALGAMWTLCYEMVFYFFVSALFVKGWHRQAPESQSSSRGRPCCSAPSSPRR